MGWQEKFKDKIVSADEAMKAVKAGDRIVEEDFTGEPLHLTEALVRRAQELNGKIEICVGGNIGPCDYLKEEMQDHVHLNSLYGTPAQRKLMEKGLADFTPMQFNEWPRFFAKDSAYRPDVALIELAQPDENGDCLSGCTTDMIRALVDSAKVVIAQINTRLPRVQSDVVNLSEVDYIVPFDEDPVLLPADELNIQAGPVEEAICNYVVDLVEDGSTLQIGRGKLPDFILRALESKKDLGVHSELISNGIMNLMKKGVVTNKYKKVFPGVTICNTIAGDQAFYEWADRNTALRIKSVDFTNDPAVIAQNPKVVSINSCTQMDLLGQASADMIGTRQYSGIGGFCNFVRGARMCPDGKTILIMPSTAAGGKASRISTTITPGAAVCATRYDTDYVVTEYGVAQLWGKKVSDRAKALIAIAHPDFREELTDYAKRVGLITL